MTATTYYVTRDGHSHEALASCRRDVLDRYHDAIAIDVCDASDAPAWMCETAHRWPTVTITARDVAEALAEAWQEVDPYGYRDALLDYADGDRDALLDHIERDPQGLRDLLDAIDDDAC